MKILDKTFTSTTRLLPILVSAITILCTCSSCEKDHSFKKKEKEEEIKLNDTYLCPPVPQGQIKVIGYAPRAEPFLGAGYDVMGDFLNNSSVKESVLDLNKIPEDEITHIKAFASFANGYEGKEVTDFLTSIQEKTNIVPPAGNTKDLLFTGTIDNYEHFSDPYDYSSQYSFACEDATWTEEIMRLHPMRLKSYLSDQFKEDLTRLSPESLIETYGTHVLKTVHLGSRTRTLYRSVVANDDKKYALTAYYGLTARQKQIYKKPNITTYEPEEEVARNHGGTIFVECLGGDPSTIPFLTLTPNEVVGDPMDLTSWRKSLNSSNLALSELKADHLLPIHELIADPAKKEQVRQAIGDYIHSRQLKVRKTAPLFQVFNKMFHKYCLSYNDFLKLPEESWACSAPLGSIDLQPQPQTVPLYQYSNSLNDRFTLDQKVVEGMEFQGTAGYVYSNYQNGLLTVFEIWNGLDYAYTTEDKEAYGENKSWKKTGMIFYIKKIS